MLINPLDSIYIYTYIYTHIYIYIIGQFIVPYYYIITTKVQYQDGNDSE